MTTKTQEPPTFGELVVKCGGALGVGRFEVMYGNSVARFSTEREARHYQREIAKRRVQSRIWDEHGQGWLTNPECLTCTDNRDLCDCA